MTNAFIWRKEAIGLWKETVAWTPVAPAVWIPKKSGIVRPKFEEAVDDSWYWVIDEVYDTQTTKNTTEANIWGMIRDDFIGYLLLWALGTRTALIMWKPTSITWTPLRWEACYVWTNLWSATWTGTLKKIILIWAVTYYFVTTVTWSLTTGQTIKQSSADAWTLVAFDLNTYTAVKAHLFERANTNSHQTFTLYSSNPIWIQKSNYTMIDKLNISCEVWDYANFEVAFMGKQLASSSAYTPAYTESNPFLAKNCAVVFADTEALLNAWTSSCVQTFNLNINKNLTDIQCFWSTDVDSFYNQQLTIDWDMEALYEDVTLRDYVINSTKKACRFSMINTDVTAIVTGIYPSMYIDMAKVWLKDWKTSDDINKIVSQTMWYTGQYDASDAMSIEILLLNKTASY